MGTLSQRDFEEYLKESSRHEDQSTEEESTEDDVSLDADWLREVGFDFLIDFPKDEDEEEAVEGVMSTLTRNQAEAVRRRVEQVRAATSSHRRQSKARLPDVRDVFPTIQEDGPKSLPSHRPNTFHGDLVHERSTQDGPARPQSMYHLPDGPPPQAKSGTGVKQQSSVDEVRSVYKSDVEDGNRKQGKHWMDKHLFFRGGAHYKFAATPSGIPESGTGVEVLSYNIRSSMKRLVSMAPSRRKNDEPLMEENDINEDQNTLLNQNYGFEVLDSYCDNDLPDVTVLDSPLGVTWPGDLGPFDSRSMLSLALIELTALFDEHDLTYRRRKTSKRKNKDGSVFGVPLLSLVEEDRQRRPRTMYPIVFEKLVNELERRGLQEEGILRKTASLQVVEGLKDLLDSNRPWSEVDEVISNASVHDLAYLIKSFIRELPEPLLTNTYMEAFLLVPALPDFLDRLKALNLLVMLLPDCHRETLKRLLDLLNNVSDNEACNRMSPHNLSLIMAPNLFPPYKTPGPKLPDDITTEVALAAISAQVTLMLCKYKEVVFTVPPCLIKQMREQNQEALALKAQKGRKKVTKKEQFQKPRSSSDPYAIQTKPNSSPPRNRQSLSVQIECDRWRVLTIPYDSTTKVQAFLSCTMAAAGGCNRIKMITDTPPPSSSEAALRGHDLYEVGGNIGEIRHDPEGRIGAIYRSNPTAEWKIKCRN